MAVVIPIVTEYSDRGLQAAMRSIKNADGPMNKLSAATAAIGPALAAAGVAAGAFAVKLGVDGVQAAMAEQDELAKLNQTLQNLGWAAATGDVKAFADEMARASTFDDSAIRSAFTNIAQSAPTAAAAMDTVRVAMDASVGSGKSLDAVSQALNKAYAGNTTALQRMFPWLDKNRLKTEGMDYATAALAERFTGQAAAAADTWSGKLGNVTEAFDELKEAFGTGFLNGLNKTIGNDKAGVGGLTQALYDLQPILEEIGYWVGQTAGELIILMQNVKDIKKAFDDWYKTLDGPWKSVFDAIGDATMRLLNPLNTVLGAINGVIDALKSLSGMNVSTPSLPGTGRSAGPASYMRSGPTVNVSVNAGMILDPVAASRTINRILTQGAARQGLTA